jgi:hypothetical protein
VSNTLNWIFAATTSFSVFFNSNQPSIRRQTKCAIEEITKGTISHIMLEIFPIHELHYVISLLFLTPSNGTFLACFLSHEKMKVGLCDLHAACVSVNPRISFWSPEPIFMKLGMCIKQPSKSQRRTS